MLIKDTESSVVQERLRSDSERTKPSVTDCIRSMAQETGSPSGMGARGRKVATAQLSGSEIDQDQYTLSTRDRVRLVKHRDEPLACAGVVTSPRKDVTDCGAELRVTKVAKRGGDRTAASLVEDGVCTVEGLTRCGMLAPIRMDGGLDGGKPAGDGWSGTGLFPAGGEVIQRGHGQAFSGGKLRGVPVGDRGELIVCHFPGGIELQPVVGTA
jgi:hypothetical protein